MALLEDKVLLVNGGSQGVGAGIVRAAVRERARVAFAGRRFRDSLGSNGGSCSSRLLGAGG